MTPEPSKVPAATGLLSAKLAATPMMRDDMAKPAPYEWKIVWSKVFVFIYLHYAVSRAAYLFLTGQMFPYFYTWLWVALIHVLTVVGVTAGAHRLWAHRAYKAKWQLRVLLMLCQTLSFQNHIYDWVRDHRVHHKFTDTDADPHNSKRGFFFAHMGWLLIRKHPEVGIKGATVDFSDLERDPVVMFQKKYYLILVPLIAFVMPTLVPTLLWGESVCFGWYGTTMTRYLIALHGTWLVNSAAHTYGTRPIDKNLSPRENAFVAHITFGEGWHNYHHVFPWDYKAAELGNYKHNVTTAFIDFFSRVGWAYDLKTASREMVEKRVRRTGDGSHPYSHHDDGHQDDGHHDYQHGDEVWGWGDEDMSQDDILSATTINPAHVRRRLSPTA